MKKIFILCLLVNALFAANIKNIDSVIAGNKNASIIEKLESVNSFFNSFISYKSDKELYGVEDYWATPAEVLKNKAGDCEDFAIAKYFALIKMGVNKNQLKITYSSKVGLTKQAHMVLTYTHSNGVVVVLDNYYKKLSTLDKRVDLNVVYSFNEDAIFDKNLVKVGSNNLKKWAHFN